MTKARNLFAYIIKEFLENDHDNEFNHFMQNSLRFMSDEEFEEALKYNDYS